MRKGMLCASVLVCLLLLTLIPSGSQAAGNTDAYFAKDEFTEQAVQGEESPTYDYLEVNVTLYVNVSGDYSLYAALDVSAREITSITNNTYLSPGRHVMSLRFGNREIYNGKANDHYTVHLILHTPNFRLGPPVEEFFQTAFYSYQQFNPDFIAPFPAGSEFSYTEDLNQTTLTISNGNITFIFNKKSATMTYYYARDGEEGENGRFTVAFERVLSYKDSGDSFFERDDATHAAVLAKGLWRTDLLEKGVHRAFGPYVKFNITYSVDLIDLRDGSVASPIDVTFSFYFTGNAHPSADRRLSIAGATQAELQIKMRLAHTVSGTGLVLEQVVKDTTQNHDFMLRSGLGDLHYTLNDRKTRELWLIPRSPEIIPKMSFLNRWDAIGYAVYTWATPAGSSLDNISTAATTDVSYIPEGAQLRLFLAYHTKGLYTTISASLQFGLEGTTPPPPPPPPELPPKHDPLLYLLGSLLALSIIFLTMRIRTRSYIEEEEEIERIEERELAGELEEAPPPTPVSIEEKAIGEEEEWRRSLDAKKVEEEAGPGGETGKPGEQALEKAVRPSPPAPKEKILQDEEGETESDAGAPSAEKKGAKPGRGGR